MRNIRRKKRWLEAGSMGFTRLEKMRGRTTWKQRSAVLEALGMERSRKWGWLR